MFRQHIVDVVVIASRLKRGVCASVSLGKLVEEVRVNTGELQALTADKGYDCTWLREYLREDLGVRPLIKHCINKPYDHAHNARIDDDLYHQRSMSESVFSSVKRSLGVALRARSWYREFRELALMCAVYNIKKAAEQEIPIPSGD